MGDNVVRLEERAMLKAITTGTSSPRDDDAFTCFNCGARSDPIVIDMPGGARYIRQRCPACKAAAETEMELRRQEREKCLQFADEMARRQRIAKLFEQSQLGPRFARSRFDTWEFEPGTGTALQACRNYVDNWPPTPVGDYPIGLLISGSTGCGKTHLAAAIANELMQREVSVVFQSVPELLIRIRSTYGRESTETEAQLLDALVGCDLLVLDDLGTERVTQWTESTVYTIIDQRYRFERPLIATTNLTPKQLETAVGTRTMDRLVEICRIVLMKGRSYRRKRAERRARHELPDQ